MASPKKLSHIVLQTNRRREMIDWYCTVLGAEILYEADRISFISYDDEHHRVAFLDPGPLTERQFNRENRGNSRFNGKNREWRVPRERVIGNRLLTCSAF